MAKKDTGRRVVANNKKARHDYHILDTYEAGLALMGTEVKSLRMGRASLVDGFCQFTDGELWLEGVHIPEYLQGSWTNHSARRRRKLLLHRSEMDMIQQKTRESERDAARLKTEWQKAERAAESARAAHAQAQNELDEAQRRAGR